MSAEFGNNLKTHVREVRYYVRDRAGSLTALAGVGSYNVLESSGTMQGVVMGVMEVGGLIAMGFEYRQRHRERNEFLAPRVWQGPDGERRMRDISDYRIQPYMISVPTGRLHSDHVGYERIRDRRALKRLKQEGITIVRAHGIAEQDRTVVTDRDVGTVITLTESKDNVTLSSIGQETGSEGEQVTVKRTISYRDVPYSRRCGSLVVQAQEERTRVDDGAQIRVYSALSLGEVQILQEKLLAELPLVA